MTSKQYSLKAIETQLLNTVMQQQATMLSNLCSFIAIERLNMTVTENTRFEINDGATEITISETPETGEVIDAAK